MNTLQRNRSSRYRRRSHRLRNCCYRFARSCTSHCRFAVPPDTRTHRSGTSFRPRTSFRRLRSGCRPIARPRKTRRRGWELSLDSPSNIRECRHRSARKRERCSGRPFRTRRNWDSRSSPSRSRYPHRGSLHNRLRTNTRNFRRDTRGPLRRRWARVRNRGRTTRNCGCRRAQNSRCRTQGSARRRNSPSRPRWGPPSRPRRHLLRRCA